GRGGLLCRRRRQDARARRDDALHRPDLRMRRRAAPARPHAPAPCALRREQRAAARDRHGTRSPPRSPRRPRGPGAGGCAVQRHRDPAPQPRPEVAHRAGRRRAAGEPAVRHPPGGGPAREAGWCPRLCDLQPARGRECRGGGAIRGRRGRGLVARRGGGRGRRPATVAPSRRQRRLFCRTLAPLREVTMTNEASPIEATGALLRQLQREFVEDRVAWQLVALAACLALAWLLAARFTRWRRERKAATEVPSADDLPVEAPVVLAEVASRIDEDPRRLGELTVAAAEQRAAD